MTVVPATASAISAAAHDVRLPEVTSAVTTSAAASLVSVAAVATSASVMIASSAWVVLVISGAPVAALMVVVMVPLLLALHANIRHDHLGAVPHGHTVPRVVPAAPVVRRRQVLPGSVDKKSVQIARPATAEVLPRARPARRRRVHRFLALQCRGTVATTVAAVVVVPLGGRFVQVFPGLPVVPVEPVTGLRAGAGEGRYGVAIGRCPVPVVLVRGAVSGTTER